MTLSKFQKNAKQTTALVRRVQGKGDWVEDVGFELLAGCGFAMQVKSHVTTPTERVRRRHCTCKRCVGGGALFPKTTCN
jgi:hypothetical protein